MLGLELVIEKLTVVEKHIDVLNNELGLVAVRLAVLENQVSDILWLQRLLLGTVVVAITGAILASILKKRNNAKN